MNTISNELKLPRSLPEEQGISSNAIIEFLQAMESKKIELHSIMLLRHGHVVAEGWWSPFNPEQPHMLFSLSKSFTSTAIGFAVAEQLLSLEDKVISFFPEDLPAEISANLALMDISHLLMMGTGHTMDTTLPMQNNPDGNWVRGFLECTVDKEPGTYFLYNTGATYMLSAILHKVTGLSLLEYLEPRLFNPLDIRRPSWESCPRGINVGGFGLSVTTEDIAKFGQLYLQQGRWNNQQLVSQEWVAAATSKQISNGDGLVTSGDWSQGYGYQFWQCRHGLYRGDGAFGQFCIVMPEQDAVVAITSCTDDMQEVMNSVWDILLPAMKPAEEFPQDTASASDLAARLDQLAIHPHRVTSTSRLEERLSGQIYKLDTNPLQMETLAVTFNGEEARLDIQGNWGRQSVLLGRGKWAASKAGILSSSDELVHSSFTWLSDDKLELTLQFIESPFRITAEITLESEASSLLLEQHVNVTQNPDNGVLVVKGYLTAD